MDCLREPNEYDYETFSIDPAGCRDIDDALHLKELGDKTFEIGIHIADVASKLDMEKINFCFYSTIYFDGGKVDNMLNDDFTFNEGFSWKWRDKRSSVTYTECHNKRR